MILSHTLLFFFLSFFRSFFLSFLPSFTVCLLYLLIICADGYYCTWSHSVTQTHIHTYKHGRTPLDEGSASRKTSTWQLITLTTDSHAPGRIRTRNPRQWAAGDLRLTTRGHWDQPVTYLLEKKLAHDDDDDTHAVHTIFTTRNKKYWLE